MLGLSPELLTTAMGNANSEMQSWSGHAGSGGEAQWVEVHLMEVDSQR